MYSEGCNDGLVFNPENNQTKSSGIETTSPNLFLSVPGLMELSVCFASEPAIDYSGSMPSLPSLLWPPRLRDQASWTLSALAQGSPITRVCKPCAALGRAPRTCCKPCTIPGCSCFVLASSLHSAVWFKVQSWFSFDLGRLLPVCVRLAAGMWTIRNVYLSQHHAEFQLDFICCNWKIQDHDLYVILLIANNGEYWLEYNQV